MGLNIFSCKLYCNWLYQMISADKLDDHVMQVQPADSAALQTFWCHNTISLQPQHSIRYKKSITYGACQASTDLMAAPTTAIKMRSWDQDKFLISINGSRCCWSTHQAIKVLK